MISRDIHSFSAPDRARVRHISLDLNVDFGRHVLYGTCTLTIETSAPDVNEIVLDTRALCIEYVGISAGGREFTPSRFNIGPEDPILGAPLTVAIQENTRFVTIRYSTTPAATALQWLDTPFLYTQSQAIHARSWIPLQDSPAVRVTYDAHIHVPDGLQALMSARLDANRFVMPEPIPSYLIALAAGDLAFRATGKRTGVWAPPVLIEKAVWEFADMERMLEAAEELYGPYRWERYDVLVLPAAFPFGGMENPRLTFATPTIIAGDRSLVSLIAHELAHSWSGNLVTNATWSDFWLNEGFTVYIERRILEHLYGTARAQMEAVLGYRELRRELERHPASEQILHIDLTGRDPDDGVTSIPYEKGALLLLEIEKVFGRERFDAWLKDYFDHFAFQSMTTATFLDYIRSTLFLERDSVALDRWIFEPGLPDGVSEPYPDAFHRVQRAVSDWRYGKPIVTDRWSTHEWLNFLHAFPPAMSDAELSRLDETFHLSDSGNNEILAQWLLMAARNRFMPAYSRLVEFLTTVGRRKYIKPLYEAMDPSFAHQVYKSARSLYHPITQQTIDALLKPGDAKAESGLN